MKPSRIISIVGVLIFSATLLAVPAYADPIDSTLKFAWGENVGWFNWGTPEGAVDVPPAGGPLTGWVWGENVGWVSLNCSNTASCGTVNYGVSNSGTELTGYAWGENIGWVSMNCSNTASCGSVAYSVTYDDSSRTFAGYAWGENIGWVSMNCSNTASCGSADYKVALNTPTPTPGGGGGGGGVPSPSASPSGTPTASPTVFPSASPTPVVTPLPTPSASPMVTVTPSASPPIRTPPSSPSPIPPSGPPRGNPLEQLSDFLDSLAQFLLGPLGPLAEICGGSAVQSAACGTTAVGVAATALSLIAAAAQQELAAGAYSMFQVFGLKRKAKVWGVIYDSVTKRPIPFAKVELLLEGSGRPLEARFADRDGRYGFLTTPDSLNTAEIRVAIRPSKPGYLFPSTRVTGARDFVVYEHLYQGGFVAVRRDGVLNFNIPLDPISARRPSMSGFGVSMLGVVGDRILALMFYVGLVTVPLNYALSMTRTNLIVMVVFFAANLFRLLVVYRPYGMTLDVLTGKPMPFTLVTVTDATGKRIAFSVSDEYGRFILSAPQGEISEMVAYTPANIVPQRVMRETIGRRKGGGWITEKLRI